MLGDNPPANPTASVFTEYYEASHHIVIGRPAQTPPPAPTATSENYPFYSLK